jgi:HPt (histidine-containing phosphotransfer) domain-containing protein
MGTGQERVMSCEFEVCIDEAIRELVPRFLANVRREVKAMRQALGATQLDEVRRLGHSLKGSGYGYGFSRLGDLGRTIEAAAAAGEPAERISARLDEVEEFVNNVRVRFATQGG